MKARFITLMVLVCLCFTTGLAHATEDGKSAVKSDDQSAIKDDEQLASDEAVISIEETIRQQVEAGRQRAFQMSLPRNEKMAEIGKISEQVEARKQAILAENETAAELEAEIAELDKILQEKSQALAAIFDTDEDMLALRAKQGEAQVALRKSQIKLREEIARQHLERRKLQDQAREAAAAKAAAEAEATVTAETSEKE